MSDARPGNGDASGPLALANDALDHGRPGDAERFCREFLNENPDKPDGFAVLVRALEAQNRIGEAVGAAQKAHRAAPEEPDALFHLGRLLIDWEAAEIEASEAYAPYELSFPWGSFPFPVRNFFPAPKAPQGIAALRRVLSLNPDHRRARALLGLELIRDEETLLEGFPLVQKTLNEAPELPEGHLGTALLALRQADFTLTAAAAKGTLDRRPEESRALALVALTECAAAPDSGDVAFEGLDTSQLTFLAEILAAVRAAGKIGADQADTVDRLCRQVAECLTERAVDALISARAFVFAARCIDRAARLERELPAASVAAGALACACSAFGPARAALNYALERDPGDRLALRTLAKVELAERGGADLSGLGDQLAVKDLLDLSEIFSAALDFPSAELFLRKAAELDSDDIVPTLKLAQNLSLQNRLADATAILEAAAREHPGNPEIEGDLCNLYLAAARLEGAWPLYESRLRRQRGSTPRPMPPVPRWDGQALDGKTVLIWREEGIGDEIRFSSCLPDAIDALGCRIVYECAPRLTELYRRSFPGMDVRAEDLSAPDDQTVDYHLPAGSLPGLFRRRIEDFPADGKFLTADPARVRAWRNRLAELGDGPKIGIGWRSLNLGWHKLPLHSTLGDWAPVFSVPGLQFVNLQCGLWQDELVEPARRFGVSIHHFDDVDVANDMEEVAALMSALDAVVSCQCWLLHLGGGLGVKVFSFNGRPNPYTMGLDYNPWAPNAEIFYRAAGADWATPMSDIADRLAELFKDRLP